MSFHLLQYILLNSNSLFGWVEYEANLEALNLDGFLPIGLAIHYI